MSCSRKVSVRKKSPVRGLWRRNPTSSTWKRSYFGIYSWIVGLFFFFFLTKQVFVFFLSISQRSLTSKRVFLLETGSEPLRYPRRWLSLRWNPAAAQWTWKYTRVLHLLFSVTDIISQRTNWTDIFLMTEQKRIGFKRFYLINNWITRCFLFECEKESCLMRSCLFIHLRQYLAAPLHESEIIITSSYCCLQVVP